MCSHTLEVCWEVALRDEKNKMAARETSNTHTNIIRNKNKTDKPTVTVYRTQGKVFYYYPQFVPVIFIFFTSLLLRIGWCCCPV